MNSTNVQRMNLPLQELLPMESGAGVMIFRVRWQTSIETVSNRALQKIRLELAPPITDLLTHFNA